MPRWPGGLIRKTPVTPAGPLQNGAAPGMWSLADAAYWTKQGLWPTAGNILAVEDVFSTYLYTGNGATQTITNGINLSGQGGLVWNKKRNNADDHFLWDTVRPIGSYLSSNLTGAQGATSSGRIAYSTTGFSWQAGGAGYNQSGETYASWTFREAPKFFDVVTYTGTGANRTIAHNLGVAPGCIIVKRTDTTGDWQVYHRGYDGSFNASYYYFTLNSDIAVTQNSGRWNNTQPASTEFTVGTNTNVNASGGTYVAYLFAHDTTSDGIIQCGSYTGNGSATGPTISLGWEPQWVMIKSADPTTNWQIIDNMRGMPVGTADATLQANLSNAETSVEYASPTATGFRITSTSAQVNTNGSSYIYMAIRRGPMKTPTLGTSVFAPVARTGTGANATVSAGFVTDMVIEGNRFSIVAGTKFGVWDRMRSTSYLLSTTTNAEGAAGTTIIQANPWDVMDGYKVGTTSALTNASANQFINWMFRRAPGFFDEVCYTGTGSTNVQSHNLGVAPELVILKSRSTGGAGYNWPAITNTTVSSNATLLLNNTTSTLGGSSSGMFTATTFNVGSTTGLGSLYGNQANQSGVTFVAYLFASCPGVSKVGSYTGTGALQTINCAFTTGARFVLIKRTDSTGDWYVWDSARGISSGNDPYLLLNTTDAEATGTNYVDTDTTGFKVTAAAPAGINAVGGTYIFLAIA